MNGRRGAGATLGILSAAFFLAALPLLLQLNLLHLTDRWKDNLRIRVFFGIEVPEARAMQLKESWAGLPEVSQVTWVGRDQALETLLGEERGKGGGESLERLVADLGGNPLPNSVSITLRPPYRTSAAAEAFTARLQTAAEVEAVQYDRKGLRGLDRLAEGIRGVGTWGGGAMGISLLVLVILAFRGGAAPASEPASPVSVSQAAGALYGGGIGAAGALAALILAWGLYAVLSRSLLQGVELFFFPAVWMMGGVLLGGLLGGIGGLLASLPRR